METRGAGIVVQADSPMEILQRYGTAFGDYVLQWAALSRP